MNRKQLHEFITEKASRLDDIIATLSAVKGERYAKAAAVTADVVNAYKLGSMHNPHAAQCVMQFTNPALMLGGLAAGIDVQNPDACLAFSKDVMTFCTASFVELPHEPDSLGG